MVIASVITHPEKGTNYSELGGTDDQLPAWVADKDACFNKVIGKGITINGNVITDVNIVKEFIDAERTREIDDHVSGNNHQTDAQKESRALYAKLVGDNWTCLQDMGWSREMKLVPVKK